MGRKGEEIFMRIVDIHEGRERGCILDKQMGMADKAHVENEVVMFVHLFVYRHKNNRTNKWFFVYPIECLGFMGYFTINTPLR